MCPLEVYGFTAIPTETSWGEGPVQLREDEVEAVGRRVGMEVRSRSPYMRPQKQPMRNKRAGKEEGWEAPAEAS